MTTMLDEVALRRPEFTEGVAITLSDGQEWMFPLPVMADFYPAFKDGKLTLVPGTNFGPDYDVIVDEFLEADTFGDEHLTLTALAYELLGRNYQIEHRDLRYLLRIKQPGDPRFDENRAMWGEIAAAALGKTRSPKPIPVGSEP